ncbi:esterase [Pseudohongiella nitratireducens]|uniref:Esterase n=1 Tax=Pseudohongiella nitratireducens TaxID=1768907 RepID=A0A916QLH1_9GAMM|nr:patatin-like phospholipase family protein [Pseudohongiella nitratireducens]GFZ79149.1 esterase [Pseudohongiella nitratireducens]
MAKSVIPVSLVLGSGGARGLAHIGVIRALEEAGVFEVRSVSGSSVGALIGAMYAAGKLDEYEEWVRTLTTRDIWGLLDFSFTWSGLFKGDKLMSKMQEMLGDVLIEDLPVAFTAVATDVDRRREVWLDRGSLYEAVRASIAIPGFFTPVVRDNCVLVDGGLLSPLPIAPVQRSGAEKMIVVSLNGQEEAEWLAKDRQDETPAVDIEQLEAGEARLQGFSPDSGAQGKAVPQTAATLPQAEVSNGSTSWFRRMLLEARGQLGFSSEEGEQADSALEIMTKSLDSMQDRIARHQLAAYQPDSLIEISVNSCGMLDFHRGEEMIALGHQQAKKVILEAVNGSVKP